MAERRENSLLVSLRELKEIEEDRVREEEDAVRTREEAERRAREDAIRQAKEAEDRKIRDAENKIRREKEERERKIREEQLRLEEAERRARVDAEAKLAEVRIQQEARIKASKAPPVRMIVGITLTFLVVSGGAIGYVVTKNMEERQEQERKAQETLRQQREAAEAKRQQILKEQEDLKKNMGDLKGKLDSATSEADKQRIRQQMADTESRSQKRQKALQGDTKKPAGGKSDSDNVDPLGNLPGMNN